MSRTALARAYRPRRFSEVATQEHVSATLRTAVQRERVAHAYLFCGPRGVGKTTLARVLAMALNCPNRTAEGEPCGVCDSCERIWSGRTSLDVIEIDAASNRGVDDARDLRERAMYAPSEHGRYKVYIIDEAHMLTREAWNALLKILEEPPPRVIFVFATTEPQKIQQAAPPILSRCQRFDFHRIGTTDLVARMRDVLAGEEVAASDAVLLPIAQKADGGMRDALSLLDQVLSFTDGNPTSADVTRVLGLVEDELYLELAEIVATRQPAQVFGFVAELLAKGYDLAEFYRGLADFLRALLMLRLDGAAPEIRQDLRERYVDAAARFEPGDLLRMLSQVAELDADGRFRKSGQQQILIELLLLRFAFLDRTVTLEEIIGALGGEGGGSPAAPAGVDQRGGSPSPADRTARANPEEPLRSGRGGGTLSGTDRGADGTDPVTDPPHGGGGGPAMPPVESAEENEGPVSAPVDPGRRQAANQAVGGQSDAMLAGVDPPASPAAPPRSPGAGPSGGTSSPGHAAMAPLSPAPEHGRAEEEEVAAPPAAVAQRAGPLELPQLRAAWRRFLDEAPRELAGMGLMLRGAELSLLGSRTVSLALPGGSPVIERLRNPRFLQALEAGLAKRLGGPVTIRVGETNQEEAAPRRITAEGARAERLRRLASEEPVLRAAVQEWDLELLE